MGFLLGYGFWQSIRVRQRERGLTQQLEDRAVLGLEAAAFRAGETLLGELKGSQVGDGLAGALEAVIEAGG